MTPKQAYATHKANAKKRNIPFEITFDEWVAWWRKHLGPDWMSKRGIHRGQYVMARYEDKGTYCSGNVQCITTEQNIREKIIERTHAYRAKMSLALTGKKPTDETRAKLSSSLRRNWLNPDYRAKMTAAQRKRSAW